MTNQLTAQKEIDELIAQDKVEDALHRLADTKEGANLILIDYMNEKWLLEHNLISEESFNAYKQQILYRIRNLYDKDTDDFEPEATVFLSYNRADYKEALLIKERLADHNIKVHIDQSDVIPGESIEDFIYRQTRENTAVMLLISERSLTSAWVSYEITTAIFNKHLNDKQVIPVKLDDKFMDNNFSLFAHEELDRKIEEINESIRKHQDRKFEHRHIDDERQRLCDAKNKLGEILKKLRQIAVYSFIGDDLDVTLNRIVKLLLK